MQDSIIKYYRTKDNKIIIIPSELGVKYFDEHPPNLVSDSRAQIPFVKDVELIAGQKVIAWIATLVHPVIHIDLQANTAHNTIKFRFFTQPGTNYYLNLINVPKDSKF